MTESVKGHGPHGRGPTIIQTARGPIEYRERGVGEPVLIVHGTPGGGDQGVALSRVLALGGFRAISPSRPGYLGTPLAVGRSPEEQADAMEALLDALGIARAGLVSNSAGGLFALHFALRHPDRLTRMVLLQSVTAPLDISVDDLLHAALLLPRSTRLAPAVLARAIGRREPSLVWASLALARSTLPTLARREGIMNDSLHLARPLDGELGAISAPTLLIHGTADLNVPYAQSVAAATAIPGARLLSVPGGDHSSILFERRVSGAVRYFLRGAARPQRRRWLPRLPRRKARPERAA